MSKKLLIRCCCGMGITLVIHIACVLWLWLPVLIKSHKLPQQSTESKAVGYIIENIDDFRDEIEAMGYDVRIAYTLEDLWGEDAEYDEYRPRDKKIGYKDRGELILSRGDEKYTFDDGINHYETKIDKGTLVMYRDGYDKIWGTPKANVGYNVHVGLRDGEFSKSGILAYDATDYNVDFTRFDARYLGDDIIRDKMIKEHVSAEQLRQTYEKCVELQRQLVELYEKAKGGNK